MGGLGPNLSSCGQRRFWSDCADAQADLSSLGAQSLCWFCHVQAHIVFYHYADVTERKCNICHKEFEKAQNLRNHMRIHDGTQQFRCNFCGALFSRKIDRDRHNMVHTGEKPNKCDRCPYSCIQPGDRHRHKLKHSEQSGAEMWNERTYSFPFSRWNEPRHEKTCLRGLRPGKTQTDLLSYRSYLGTLHIVSTDIILRSEQQWCWSDCADAQADLHLCCSHMA